jgi:hypothetical protein
MNLGYGKLRNNEMWNKLNNAVCPVCAKDVYIKKDGHNYACSDTNCHLSHGVEKIIENYDKVLELYNELKISHESKNIKKDKIPCPLCDEEGGRYKTHKGLDSPIWTECISCRGRGFL